MMIQADGHDYHYFLQGETVKPATRVASPWNMWFKQPQNLLLDHHGSNLKSTIGVWHIHVYTLFLEPT